MGGEAGWEEDWGLRQAVDVSEDGLRQLKRARA